MTTTITGELSGAGAGSWLQCYGEELVSVSPIDGQALGTIRCASGQDYEGIVQQTAKAFEHWRLVPAPKRGEIVRQMGNALRQYKTVQEAIAYHKRVPQGLSSSMRRQTCTVNWSGEMPLAQGIKFEM